MDTSHSAPAQPITDTERLNWLGYTGHSFVKGTDVSCWKIAAPDERIRTIRDAIDAAMRTESQLSGGGM